MRVVLGTNVLVAALIARGVCADVFERVIVGENGVFRIACQ